ncbi:MAG TPA: monooxygenase [Polyangiales bacterium]
MSPFGLCWHRQRSAFDGSRGAHRTSWGLLLGALVALGACSDAHSIGSQQVEEEGERPGDEGDDDGSTGEEEGLEEDDDLPDDGTPLTYFEHAKPIIDQKCGPCHSEGGIGPMQFGSYKDVKPLLPLIKADISADIMPPWRATGELDVFEGDRRLSPKQKKTLLRWIDDGGEEGDPESEPEALPKTARALPRIDETLTLPSSFEPNLEPDTYRCFVFEWPHDTTKFITGLSVEPERREMVHHAIVYLIGPNAAQGIRDRDAAEEGEGFECFSSAGLGAWITSYEPGGYGQEFSGGVGMQVQPGSVIVLQVHYNTLKGKFQDRSRVDLMLADEVERAGRTTLIMNYLWLAENPLVRGGTMLIPANEPDVVHRYQGAPLGLTGANDIFGVDLHMHTLGRAGSIGIVRRGSGEMETLLDIPDWAFEWQETYRFKEPVRLEQGDQLWVECRFDNTADKQPMIDGKRLEPRDVRWGEGTTDEMCLGNVLTAPAK